MLQVEWVVTKGKYVLIKTGMLFVATLTYM